jgi:hypothetical protein
LSSFASPPPRKERGKAALPKRKGKGGGACGRKSYAGEEYHVREEEEKACVCGVVVDWWGVG